MFYLFIQGLTAQVFTEIMYNPPGTDSPNEFVEFFNLSPTDTIDFSGWTICDGYSCDELTDFGYGLSLAPQQYGLLLESDYQFFGGLYEMLLPDSILVITTDDKSIGNGLSASDRLVFRNDNGVSVDSIAWIGTADEGFSLEKIDLAGDNSASNWAVSRDSLGTPGRENSVAPLEIDGTILSDSIRWEPLSPEEFESLTIYIPVINCGLSDFQPVLDIYEAGILLGQFQWPAMFAGDTTWLIPELDGLSSGIHALEILLSIPDDQDQSGNNAEILIQVSYPWNAVSINEFLAQPDLGQLEFIEIYCHRSINTAGWGISDNTGNIQFLSAQEFSAGAYLVLCGDSSLLTDQSINLLVPAGWPTLNNSADGIYIYDQTGKIIDSLTYDESWGLKEGRSQEKLRPDLPSNESTNWNPAVNVTAQTPGEPNSIYCPATPENGLLECFPNPFSPDGDGHEDQLNIHYILPFDIGILKLEVFDMVGRQIATPRWNTVAAKEALITWDGKNSNGDKIPIGLYILKLTATDQASGQTWERTEPIAAARKL